jgi:hypothetical protein
MIRSQRRKSKDEAALVVERDQRVCAQIERVRDNNNRAKEGGFMLSYLSCSLHGQ